MKYFTLLLIFTTNFSFAQESKYITELYTGQIGKYPIVMLVSHHLNSNQEEEYRCVYMYKNQGITIQVDEAEFKSNVLTLTLNYDVKEKFVLSLLPDKTWSGTWQDKKSKTLPVSLKPLNINSINHKMANLEEVKNWKKEDELLYIATSNLSFVQDTVTYSGKMPIYWFKDSIYGTSFFRLGAKYKEINKILLKQHLNNIEQEGRGCQYDGGNDRTFEIENLKDGLLSFYHSKAIIYCPRAAHPGWAYESMTFDLKLDKQLSFDEIFTFSDKPIIEKEEHSEEFYKYREEQVAPKIVAILRKSYAELRETPKNYTRKDDGECYYLNNEMWQYLEGWSISNKSLLLQHYEPVRGYGPCMEHFNIPYSYLKSYIVPKYRPYLLK
jgi:hypothetical protein